MLVCLVSQAQESPAVKEIREVYKEVNAAIAVCNEAPTDPCGYYVNTLTLNRQSQPWPAVGIYSSVQDFWYQRAEAEEKPEYRLRKVNIKTQRSNRVESEEYLFDPQGKLVFYFFKLIHDDQSQENRFYFKGGQLSDYAEKISEAEKDYQQWKKADAAAVQQAAGKLQELFLRTL